MEVVGAGFVITMTGEVHSPGWVGFADGKIVEIAAGPVPGELGSVAQRRNTVLIPGLVCAHGHLPLGNLRGVGENLPFLEWIHQGVLPAIQEMFTRPGSFTEGARRSVGELLAGGVTSVADSFLRAEGVAACREAGMRGIFFQEVFGSLAEDEKVYVTDTMRELDELPAVLGDHAYGYAPHTPWTCPWQTLGAVVERARAEGRRLSLHVDESEEEHLFFTGARGPLYELLKKRGILDRYRFGMTPTAYLQERGALGPDVMAVHCVQVTAEDVGRLARTGTHVVHCPVSNMKLAEGVAPILPMLEAGVRLSLGADSSASAGHLDMFEQMRVFILAQRARYRTIGPLTAETALSMATVGGADALGLLDRIGTLEVGKCADMVLVDLDGVRSDPIRNPVDDLVLLARRTDVEQVWVDGICRHLRPESSS